MLLRLYSFICCSTFQLRVDPPVLLLFFQIPCPKNIPRERFRAAVQKPIFNSDPQSIRKAKLLAEVP